MDGFVFRERESAEASELREKLSAAGFKFNSLNPKPRKSRFLAADSSFAVKELRYHALWAAHAAALHALYDGSMHHDALVGHGALPYTGLLYSSYVVAGEFIPYSDLDVRGNSIRVEFEFDSLMKALGELDSEGLKPDFILVDGSLYTNLRNLEGRESVYEEHARASASFRRVLASGRVVGMVEDSHATDLSRELGFNFTNMLLFDLSLKPGEYVVDLRDGISICYVKLPPKRLPYLAAGESRPLTVRWEFNYPGFEGDLDLLAGVWLREDDLLHPQLYPVRIADYLTRGIRVSGLLDRVAAERNLELRHRELREA